MTDILPFSAACERNKDVILDVLSPYFNKLKMILEIGTGTAQHALHFARSHPGLHWQTSDQEIYLEGIHTQLKYANIANVATPLTIDVNQSVWDPVGRCYDGLYTANTLHIMSSEDVNAFFAGVSAAINSRGYLFIYGPFKYNGQFTSESNYTFDESLRSRNCGSAIRDIEKIQELADLSGFGLLDDHSMPANNQLLIFQKKA